MGLHVPDHTPALARLAWLSRPDEVVEHGRAELLDELVGRLVTLQDPAARRRACRRLYVGRATARRGAPQTASGRRAATRCRVGTASPPAGTTCACPACSGGSCTPAPRHPAAPRSRSHMDSQHATLNFLTLPRLEGVRKVHAATPVLFSATEFSPTSVYRNTSETAVKSSRKGDNSKVTMPATRNRPRSLRSAVEPSQKLKINRQQANEWPSGAGADRLSTRRSVCALGTSSSSS